MISLQATSQTYRQTDRETDRDGLIDGLEASSEAQRPSIHYNTAFFHFYSEIRRDYSSIHQVAFKYINVACLMERHIGNGPSEP